MKLRILTALLVGIWAPLGFAQGQFSFFNGGARTRLWSLDGPLAGSGIWAQMLAGSQVDSLAPVGVPAEHMSGGIVGGGRVTVPGMGFGEDVFVQMVAWDGRLWGTVLANVPLGQLGRTDIVRVMLSEEPFPLLAPRFTQPAVVPIPEPSFLALAGIAAGIVVVQWRRVARNGLLTSAIRQEKQHSVLLGADERAVTVLSA